MQHEIKITGIDGLDAAAREFVSQVRGFNLIAFDAPMGAGKTTFISAVCRVLGVNGDAVGSPTFSIVNEYRTEGGEPVYHFDFYRIENPEEALDIGFYDYIDSGFTCLMEWPDKVAPILPEETLSVSIRVGYDGSRTISWDC